MLYGLLNHSGVLFTKFWFLVYDPSGNFIVYFSLESSCHNRDKHVETFRFYWSHFKKEKRKLKVTTYTPYCTFAISTRLLRFIGKCHVILIVILSVTILTKTFLKFAFNSLYNHTSSD